MMRRGFRLLQLPDNARSVLAKPNLEFGTDVPITETALGICKTLVNIPNNHTISVASYLNIKQTAMLSTENNSTNPINPRDEGTVQPAIIPVHWICGSDPKPQVDQSVQLHPSRGEVIDDVGESISHCCSEYCAKCGSVFLRPRNFQLRSELLLAPELSGNSAMNMDNSAKLVV